MIVTDKFLEQVPAYCDKVALSVAHLLPDGNGNEYEERENRLHILPLPGSRKEEQSFNRLLNSGIKGYLGDEVVIDEGRFQVIPSIYEPNADRDWETEYMDDTMVRVETADCLVIY